MEIKTTQNKEKTGVAAMGGFSQAGPPKFQKILITHIGIEDEFLRIGNHNEKVKFSKFGVMPLLGWSEK